MDFAANVLHAHDRDLMHQGWIRCANIWNSEINNGYSTPEAMFAYAKLLVSCVLEKGESSLEKDVIISWESPSRERLSRIRYNTQAYRASDFIHIYGNSELEEYLYGVLSGVRQIEY